MKKDNNLFLTISTVLIPLVLQILYIRYVSYHVDKDIYGDFILLQTFIVALSYVFLQIPSTAYTRFYNESEDKVTIVNEFRTLLIFINILSLIVVVIYWFVMDKFSVLVLMFVFVYFALLNNFSFNQQVFLLNIDRKKYFFIKLFESFAKFLFPIGLYYIYETLESFIIGLLIGYSFAFVYVIRNLKEYPFSFTVRVNNLKKYLVYAYPTVFIGVFSWGITFSDRYFIEYFMQTKDVAVYAILAQVAGFGSVIGQVYGLYVNPIILKGYKNNKNKTLVLLGSFIKNLMLVFIVTASIFYLLPLDIFTILIEKEIIYNSSYYNTFLILFFAILLSVLQNAYGMYFVLEKKLHIIAYSYALAFVVNIVGNFYVQEYGLIAASVSTILSYFVVLSLQLIYIRKYLND